MELVALVVEGLLGCLAHTLSPCKHASMQARAGTWGGRGADMQAHDVLVQTCCVGVAQAHRSTTSGTASHTAALPGKRCPQPQPHRGTEGCCGAEYPLTFSPVHKALKFAVVFGHCEAVACNNEVMQHGPCVC